MLDSEPKASDVHEDMVDLFERLEELQGKLLCRDIRDVRDAFAVGLALNREVKQIFDACGLDPEDSLIPEALGTLVSWLAEQAGLPLRFSAAGFFGLHVIKDIDQGDETAGEAVLH